MVGLLAGASSVLQGMGGVQGLTGGGGGADASSSSVTTTQTFTSGTMGGSDSTVLYLIVAVIALYVLTKR
jgi:hypothetical protein